jgi:hypothetical protein
MQVNTEQVYLLLEKYGCYANEACDKCGQILGYVRFTRKGDSGVWCSRECRDGEEARAPGTCKVCGTSLVGFRRGTKFCSGTCRKRENRKSQTRQISRDQQLKIKGLQARSEVLAILTQSGQEKAHSDIHGEELST